MSEGKKKSREEALLIKKQKQKNRKKTSRQIQFVTGVFVCLFLGMMSYTCYYAMTHKQEMIDNNYNSRQEMLKAQNTRGTIYASDGQALAQTVTDEDGKEIREYPFSNMFAHVVGYASNGRFGVEAQSNYYLIQSNAKLSDKVASEVSGVKYPGDSVVTTLNVDLQEVAYQSLGVYRGAIIVSEPSTGKILAMVSKPDFDPNEIEDIWDDLLEDTDSGVLLNRATQGLYPPGSTFKIVTALEYIRENPDTYQNYSYQCGGRFKLGDDVINCYHGTSHGSENFTKSFAKSCNASFANISMTLNRTNYQNTLSDLLFNKELPVMFAYNKSRVIVDESVSDSDVMQASIGQGADQITPLHMNMITCAIANDGVLMKPYLVDYVKNYNGNVMKQFSSDEYGRLMSGEEAQALKELMAEVVQSGTATKLKGLSYTAAGKTGSAEYNSVKTDSHAWFTGFAPVEDPQICVTVIIEGAGSGGDFAVPIAKRIFNAYLDGGNES
ncbi:MAG: penicillin-binding transpeptidase domain-containing protein [Bacillus sp. (in: Bacteria)]|nr:penicillin-binding transpeptidase domain-containing protein [Bacillus sp. (in: firmicutes)]MCM1427697.1 penicillin-binding transpeptidase domain-containing protein [Eubacterium sp.]